MDYKHSGVDKERGYQLVRQIQQNARQASGQMSKQTPKQANVLGGVGGFAALYALQGYEEPVLVSGTDGVGTKLKLAFDFDIYSTVGQDCVAMCANDILCSGAEPLFFLDYLACDQLQVDKAAALVEGIAQACARIDIPLVGGETAEMPGFYKDGLYDIAGFCLGVVERKQIRGPHLAQVGDAIIGLSSSGIHSNGFSLVRKILAECEEKFGPINYDETRIAAETDKRSLKELLLEPTALYVQPVRMLLQSQWGGAIHSMAHITGGGIYENLPRALSPGQSAEIYRRRIARRQIFDFLQDPLRFFYPGQSPAEASQIDLIDPSEMWHTFNMGLGFAIIVAEEAAEDILQLCRSWESEMTSGSNRSDGKNTGLQASIVGRVRGHSDPDAPRIQLID